jgi:MFS family permease
MTKSNQYVTFTISRLFVGLFSATPTILGPQMLVEIFFLHERGTVFNTFMVWSTMGAIIGPTLGGFIAAHASWPWEFWWTVALQGAVILLGMFCNGDFKDVKDLSSPSTAFLFLEETGYTREDGKVYPLRPSGFIQNRVATYFTGTRVTHTGGFKAAVSNHNGAYRVSPGSL